jgi:ABC-2 type transport system ATP-binding protein
MIEVEGLVKVYDGFRGRGTRALDGVTFTVPQGSVFGFLGPNGAGKTTTIRIAATILPPTAGAVRVGGHDAVREPIAVRRLVGYLPENPGFYPALTAAEHLEFWSEFYGVPRRERRSRAKSLLEQVGLRDAGRQKVKGFSLGMKKRLVLAQSLLHDPPIVILDEPAGGLDPYGVIYFRKLVADLHREGKTVFLSSHLLSEVQQTCSVVGIIQRGRMVAVDTPEALSKRILGESPARIMVESKDISEPAIEAVRGIPHVTSIERTEWGIVVAAEPGHDVRAEVNRALVLAGASVVSLWMQEPDLEEVFTRLTGGGAT